jgi:hypothetical protein
LDSASVLGVWPNSMLMNQCSHCWPQWNILFVYFR